MIALEPTGSGTGPHWKSRGCRARHPPLDVHVAGTDATAVKVSVFKDVHHGIRKNQGDIETVGLRDWLHGGGSHRIGRGRVVEGVEAGEPWSVLSYFTEP